MMASALPVEWSRRALASSFMAPDSGMASWLLTLALLFVPTAVCWVAYRRSGVLHHWAYLGVLSLFSCGVIIAKPIGMLFFLLADGVVLISQTLRRRQVEPADWFTLAMSYMILFTGLVLGNTIAYLDVLALFFFVLLRSVGWPLPILGDRSSSRLVDSELWWLGLWSPALALLVLIPTGGSLVVVAVLLIFLQIQPNPLSLSLLAFLILFRETSAPLALLSGISLLSLTYRWVAIAILSGYFAIFQAASGWAETVPTVGVVAIFALFGRAWATTRTGGNRSWVQILSGAWALLLLVWMWTSAQVTSPHLRRLYEGGSTIWSLTTEHGLTFGEVWLGRILVTLPAFLVGAMMAEIWRRYWPGALPKFQPWALSQQMTQLMARDWLSHDNRSVVVGDGEEGELELTANKMRGIPSDWEPILLLILFGGMAWIGLWL